MGAFLGLTFGLTWLLDLAIYLRGGLATPGVITILQLQMLLPAFSAIVLGLFFFRESPIYRGRPAGRGRWFYYYFLAADGGLRRRRGWASGWPRTRRTINDGGFLDPAWFCPSWACCCWSCCASPPAARRWPGSGWRGATGATGCSSGWPLSPGTSCRPRSTPSPAWAGASLTPLPALPGLNPTAMLIVAAVQTVLLGPFLGIVITFGEEYGWRGYLQNELLKLGRVRGVLLLGVIWGVWHWPIILMGYNYPGHPVLGVVLMTLYTIGLGVVLGYAVLKSGSVLLASFLHALNNQVAAFIVMVGFTPHDTAFSFLIGIYGLATLAVVALLILRDPIWRGQGSNLA